MNTNAIVDLKTHLKSTIIVSTFGRYQKGKWVGIDLDANIIILIPSSAPECRLYIDIEHISSIKTNVKEDG